jgi:glycosyltransferase involved in cell wall biosynthesis
MSIKAIILPNKEKFSKNESGAASIFAKDSLKPKDYKSYIIYGNSIANEKKYKNIFVNANQKNKFLSNYLYIKKFINKFKRKNIIHFEIHNRPEYVINLKKNFPSAKFIIFYHNDPTKLRGSKNLSQRKFLDDNCTNIFLSNYIRSCFYKDFSTNKKNNFVLYPGIKIHKGKKFKKKKLIVFCGKLNEAKGYDIFIKTASIIKKDKKFNDWKFISIGSEKRRKIKKNFYVKELGQISNSKILKIYEKSSIAIAPSTWNEPLGRLPLEANSRGCFVISSNKGGLPESNHQGMIIENIDEYKISKALSKVCFNGNLKKKQKKCLGKFKFNHEKFYNSLEKIRNKNVKIKKILHIANFNYKNINRLFYAFSNKINLGIVRNKIRLLTISDRDYLRKNRGIFDLNGSLSLNKKIIDTVSNNKIDLIILGHTEKIFLNTFLKIREINPNIKIVKLFIDSISNEFLNFNKFFYDYKFLNKIFITSNPEGLNKKYADKFKYIQYPVDKKIDYLKSYLKKDKNIDVFYAVSHGINRGVLKKGRIDEREAFIKFLSIKLKKYKTYFPGYNNIQPVWGANFYNFLRESKICINYSRGKYKNLYSSDRISSLIGNGCFVLNENANKYYKIFNKKELINFKNKTDLIKKIIFFLKNEKTRKRIAKNLYSKYHKLYSSKNTINYIIKNI